MIRGPQGITTLTFLAILVAVLPVNGLRRDRAWIRGDIAEYVEDFSLAANRAGREDWPDPYEQSPGTAVIIEFEPNRAAITLATDPQFGMGRLITAARDIARKSGCPAADIRTGQDDDYIAAQIDMSPAIHHGWLAREWELPLSQTAEALRGAKLPKPDILAIDPGGALDSGTGRARVPEERVIRFTDARKISPGEALHFHARGTGLDLAVFLYCGLSLIAAILFPWWLIRFVQRDPFENGPETDPAEGQRRYDRGPPYWIQALSDPALVFIPLCVAWALEYCSSTAVNTLQSVLPLSQKRLAIIYISAAALSALALLIQARFSATHLDSDQRSAGLIQPSLMKRAAPLALLLPAIAFWIPILLERASRSPSPTAALELLAWGYLSVFSLGRFINVWQRSLRKEIHDGPWYEMAQELAAAAGMTLNKVLMLNIPEANGIALKKGVIGISERLVTYLEPGEVRAVLAHEVAHVLRRDANKYLWMIRALYILMIASGAGIAVGFHIGFEPAILITLAALGLLSPLIAMATASVKRKWEFAADRQAAEWVADPELMARALVRIYTLNRRPTRLRSADELFSPHPSLVYRVSRLREMARLRNPPSSAAIPEGSSGL